MMRSVSPPVYDCQARQYDDRLFGALTDMVYAAGCGKPAATLSLCNGVIVVTCDDGSQLELTTRVVVPKDK